MRGKAIKKDSLFPSASPYRMRKRERGKQGTGSITPPRMKVQPGKSGAGIFLKGFRLSSGKQIRSRISAGPRNFHGALKSSNSPRGRRNTMPIQICCMLSAQHRRCNKRLKVSKPRPEGETERPDQPTAMVLILPSAFFTAGMLITIRVMMPSARMKE